MQKDTRPSAPCQGRLRLTPEQRQLLLSTPFARKVVGYFRQQRAKSQRLTRLKLRHMRKQKLAEFPKPYLPWLSEETLEDSVVKTQLAVLRRRRDLEGKR